MTEIAKLQGSVTGLTTAVTDMNARSDERHRDRLRWQEEHSSKHDDLKREVIALRSDADKGKGAIRAFVTVGAFITGFVAIFAVIWNAVTKQGT